jgi:hypothetical protein
LKQRAWYNLNLRKRVSIKLNGGEGAALAQKLCCEQRSARAYLRR